MNIKTKYGPMDERDLTKNEKVEHGSRIVEYYHRGELVHRSVDVSLTGVHGAGVAKSLQ
jgi:hypothetical protein